jgi:hypothetical protein
VVARVSRRVRHGNQLAAFPDQTQKALLSIYADLAYGRRVKTIRCHQDVVIAFHIGQIHGAGIDRQGIFDPANNDVQGDIQMGCGADFLYDLSQRHKHRMDWHAAWKSRRT